jgi:hypothetical protein
MQRRREGIAVWRWTGTTALLSAVLLTLSPLAQARNGNSNPGILPPNASHAGLTQGEWIAAQFKWFFEQTPQPKSLTFLPLVGIGGDTTETIEVTVPANKAVFVNVGGELDLASVTTPQALWQDIYNLAHTGLFSCTVDGYEVQQLDQYVQAAPYFSTPWPPFESPPNPPDKLAAAACVFIIPDLKPGQHTIRIIEHVVIDGVPATADLTYSLTVTK